MICSGSLVGRVSGRTYVVERCLVGKAEIQATPLRKLNCTAAQLITTVGRFIIQGIRPHSFGCPSTMLEHLITNLGHRAKHFDDTVVYYRLSSTNHRTVLTIRG
jgi:hypothetical protein